MLQETPFVSPLYETLKQVSNQSTNQFDYLSHQCGLSAYDFENTNELSKYSRLCGNYLTFEQVSVNEESNSLRKLLIKSKNETIHPNYTKYWGYLNPHSISVLGKGGIYQLYLTRPCISQFEKLLNIALENKSIIVKYARLKSVEKRHDTVIAYIEKSAILMEIWKELASYADPDYIGAVPGFATVSYSNMSLARLQEVPGNQSNGQKWQEIVSKASTDTLYLQRVKKEIHDDIKHFVKMIAEEKR